MVAASAASQLSPFEPPQQEERTSPADDCGRENKKPSTLLVCYRRSHASAVFINRVAVTARKRLGLATVVMEAMFPSLLMGVPKDIGIDDISA